MLAIVSILTKLLMLLELWIHFSITVRNGRNEKVHLQMPSV